VAIQIVIIVTHSATKAPAMRASGARARNAAAIAPDRRLQPVRAGQRPWHPGPVEAGTRRLRPLKRACLNR